MLENPRFPLWCCGIKLSPVSLTTVPWELFPILPPDINSGLVFCPLKPDPNNQTWTLPPVKAHVLVKLGHKHHNRCDFVAGLRLLAFGLNVRGFLHQSLEGRLYRESLSNGVVRNESCCFYKGAGHWMAILSPNFLPSVMQKQNKVCDNGPMLFLKAYV